ncbi:glycosyl transferase [Marinobacterium iners]|uniref:sugar transferase n=1 Tax=Marinobacterium iners TaxID=48076 RepID=UPI001AFBED70|nr:sugar transferase [Marinobacterium iners]QSR36063.1 glycosyl transferase [Marinobacterium iners]
MSVAPHIPHYERRHSRWYERLLLGLPFQFVLGSVCLYLLPLGLLASEYMQLRWSVGSVTLTALVGAYLLSLFFLSRLRIYPGARSLAHILPTVSLAWFLVSAIILLLNQPVLWHWHLYGFTAACFWSGAAIFVGRRFRTQKIAVVPSVRTERLESTAFYRFHTLAEPSFGGRRFDAVVADLHAELSPQWQRFLAHATLNRIPVYHIKQLNESITGRVRIDHLSENEFGSLQPSPAYESLKRLIDIIIVLVTLPAWLPLMLLVAVAIKLDSPGAVLFIQERVGQGGRPFKICKFRSMRHDAEKNGQLLAQSGDERITRLGRFLRRSRLDELPQFFNVLKGDMSLIGPRPEQSVFVEQFEQEIPFYAYRHVVKPGITGWAQVMQGYAGDSDETRIKIEHDFYYIKHFSLWVDLLIVLRTLRVILTGFGAR